MNRKILSLLTVASFALFMSACGGDDKKNGVGPEISCEDTEDCLDEEEDSSSSAKDEAKSSSSVKEESKSSSSSETKDESSSSEEAATSSSSEETAASSSDAAPASSSSETIAPSSSSETVIEPPASSSSDEAPKPVEYANTTPNLADLEVSGDTLFAVFQRQNADYSITHNGLLAMYKLSDGTLLDTIQLATQNPSAVKVAGGNVYVATAGAYDASYSLPADDKRGIEKVDLTTKTSSLFIAGTKLGGGVNDFVVDAKNNKGYVLIYVAYGITPQIVEVDLSAGSVTKTIGNGKFVDPQGGLEFDTTKEILYIGDRGFVNKKEIIYENIMVYSYDGSTLTPYVELDEEEEEFEFRQAYSIKAIAGIPYVFVSDYETGGLFLDFADLYSDDIRFFQDSKLAAVNDELFVMERGVSATIAKINTENGEVEWQSIASGKNPYDMVAASSTTAWVAYYGTPTLELISTSNGSTVKLIDTKEFCAVKVDATDED